MEIPFVNFSKSIPEAAVVGVAETLYDDMLVFPFVTCFYTKRQVFVAKRTGSAWLLAKPFGTKVERMEMSLTEWNSPPAF